MNNASSEFLEGSCKTSIAWKGFATKSTVLDNFEGHTSPDVCRNSLYRSNALQERDLTSQNLEDLLVPTSNFFVSCLIVKVGSIFGLRVLSFDRRRTEIQMGGCPACPGVRPRRALSPDSTRMNLSIGQGQIQSPCWAHVLPESRMPTPGLCTAS